MVPYPFRSAEELLRVAEEHNLTIANLVLANECALLADARVKIVRPAPEGEFGVSLENQVCASLLAIWRAMEACTRQGMEMEGVLPGGLNVRRRAPRMARRLEGEEPNGK